MKKLKSFFKKHYKRFIAGFITACMCFIFLSSSAFAYINNSNFQIRYIDLDNLSLYQVTSSSGTVLDFSIDNPSDADGFTYGSWYFRKNFDVNSGSNLVLSFTNNMRFVIPDAVFHIEIPFGIYFIKDTVPDLSKITQCVFSFDYLGSNGQWLESSYLVYTKLNYSVSNNPFVSYLSGVATFNLPLPNSYIFNEFRISLSDFNYSLVNATSYAFAFHGPISLSYSYNLTGEESIENGINNEESLINNLIATAGDSLDNILTNPISSLPTGVKNAFLCIGAFWTNFFNKTGLKYLFTVGLAVGFFGFIVGMGSSIISSISRNNHNKRR